MIVSEIEVMSEKAIIVSVGSAFKTLKMQMLTKMRTMA
jgi:hypothetical protein